MQVIIRQAASLAVLLLLAIAPAVGAKKPNAWYLEQKHEVFGIQKLYLGQTWFCGENVQEGTTFVRRKGDKEFCCFNRSRKLYCRGTSRKVLKREEFFSLLASSREGFEWSKCRWRYVGNSKLAGLPCKVYFLRKKKAWRLYLASDLEVPHFTYKDYLQFFKLPDVGSFPLKLESSGNGRLYVPILNTFKAKRVYVSPGRLELPSGCKRVGDFFQVSSKRTTQLMDSFAEILGD